MLYDRPYMRQAPEAVAKQTSAVTILLIVTISIFVLQQVLNVSFPGTGGRQNSFLTDWFALSADNFKDLKVWTVCSYAFLHSTTTILHLLGNMFGLFFIGRILEPLLGKQQFLILYFSGAVVGALTYLIFHFNGNNSVVGRIDNTPGIHGIDVAPELGIGFTSNGGENKIGIFDLKTLQK